MPSIVPTGRSEIAARDPSGYRGATLAREDSIRLPELERFGIGDDPLGKAFLALVLLWTLAMPVSVAISEAALWISVLVWCANWLRLELAHQSGEPESPERGPAGDVLSLIGTPLMAFWGLSVVSALASRDAVESLWELRDIFLFAAPFVTYLAYRDRRLRELGLKVFGVGIALAILLGIGGTLMAVQRGEFPGPYRPDGTLGHYMTYAGALMLAIPLLMTLRKGLFGVWHRILVIGCITVMGLTMTRSAWIGAAVGLAVYAVASWVPGREGDVRPRSSWASYGVPLTVAAMIAALFLLSLAGPDVLYERGASIFSLDNPTNVDRMAMAATGLRIIRAHPVVGIGPGLMERVYPAWRVDWAVKEVNSHLHNDVLQIAAERGLLGLGAWIWLMAALAVGTWRVLRAFGPYAAGGREARAGLAMLAAFLTMGMFEYNFSDSEVLLILLYGVTLPFAASVGERSSSEGEGLDTGVDGNGATAT